MQAKENACWHCWVMLTSLHSHQTQVIDIFYVSLTVEIAFMSRHIYTGNKKTGNKDCDGPPERIVFVAKVVFVAKGTYFMWNSILATSFWTFCFLLVTASLFPYSWKAGIYVRT